MRRRFISLAALTVARLAARRRGLVPGAGDRRGGAHHHLPLRARPRRAGGAGRRQRSADARAGSWSRTARRSSGWRERDRALFDKTGTLTHGRAAARSGGARCAAARMQPPSLWRSPRTAATRCRVRSPKRWPPRGCRAAALDNVREDPGAGVFAIWRGEEVALRRPEAAEGTAVALADRRPANPPDSAMRTVCAPTRAAALARLAAMGMESSIVSGDNAAAVQEVARRHRPHRAVRRHAGREAAAHRPAQGAEAEAC